MAASLGIYHPRPSQGQKAIECLQHDRGPFVVAAESTRMAMFFMDATTPDHVIVFANDSFLRMTGYGRDEVLGRPIDFLLACDDKQNPEALMKLETAFSHDTDSELELRFKRKDASIFCVDIFVTAVLDKRGAVLQHFASIVDLTRHKQAQRDLNVLIDELNHRVKNTLSTVQSIVWQALRQKSTPSEVQTAIESRIFALSRSHNLLTCSRWEGATLDDLAHASMEAFQVIDGGSGRISISGSAVALTSSVTLALGIAFHELGRNAVKYGALSNDEGSISIDWTCNGPPEKKLLVICWRERGGPPVTLSAKRGFGSKVIERGLPHELGGSARLDFQPAGLVCTIEISFCESNPRG
jgi:PAS domain S-box-containing protein